MAHDTRWWKQNSREKRCQSCGKDAFCFEYQGKDLAKCGQNRLCPKCYDSIVKHSYKIYITPKKFLPQLCIFILGLFIGTGIVGGYIYNFKSKSIQIVTEKEKQIMKKWAMSKTNNTAPSTINSITDAACESTFPPLIMAIIAVESRFDVSAVSKAGACGPMQVMPGMWVEILIKEGIIKCRADLFDPVLGVRSGTYIFYQGLVTAKGNLKEATRLYLEGIHIKDPKNAEIYFDSVQRYLGEQYLTLHIERMKDGKTKEESIESTPTKEDKKKDDKNK